ncbi:flavoprotein NADH-dependent oxidoreductase, partial [Mycena maculata]
LDISTLFTPFTLGSITIENRIGMCALTRNRSSQTVPNEMMRQYYGLRAVGGAGLIVTEGTLITRQGSEWPDAPGIWNKEQIQGWKKITDSVHVARGKIYCQLWHLGRLSHPEAPEQIAAAVPVYAPSAIAACGGKFCFIDGAPGYVTPTEIDDPTVLISQFRQAAINAKEAGFDGVELHGAGCLIHQFLDSTSNKRTDKWGGSVENCARFALETLKALIKVYGPNVAIKLSPGIDMGMPLQETLDTFWYLFREVNTLGLSYVTLLRYKPLHNAEFDGKKRGTPHDVVKSYSQFLADTPLFVNGGMTPAEAEELVNTGKATGVFIGAPWISHPDLGKRIRAGKPLDNPLDLMTLYGAPGVDPALGYMDYKEAVY